MAATASVTTTAAPEQEIGNHAPPLLFGSLNESIADALYQSLQRQLPSHLSALPVLGGNAKEGDMAQRLRQQYLPAADLVELYGQRNIFSLARMEPPSRRKLILQRFLGEPSSCAEEDAEMEMDRSLMMIAEDNDEKEMIKTLHKDDIPTAMDIQSVEQDLLSLQRRLQQLQQQRQTLSEEISVWQGVNENHNAAAIPSQKEERLAQQVAERLALGHALRECHNESALLLQRMTARQQERGEGRLLDDIVQPPPPIVCTHRPPAPPLTLQERYEHDCLLQLGGISAQSVATLTEALKRK